MMHQDGNGIFDGRQWWPRARAAFPTARNDRREKKWDFRPPEMMSAGAAASAGRR
jgi:hypothetical protein